MTQTPKINATTPEKTSRATPEEWVTVARVVRPQGCRGELIADLLTDFPERFSERKRLFLRASAGFAPREFRLEHYWLHKGRLVLKFVGIDSIEAVDPLRGHEVVIPRAERAPLESDAVYIGDLVGCQFYDRATAAIIGEIVDVDRESSNMPLIVVRAAMKGGEFLIPFAKAYLPSIDTKTRRMEMTLPDGLLALNDPPTKEERHDVAFARAVESGGENGAVSDPEPAGASACSPSSKPREATNSARWEKRR